MYQESYRLSIFLVPREGVEPSIPCGPGILSPVRMPFRHLGTLYFVLGLPEFIFGKLPIVIREYFSSPNFI
jgi:hypothetical protein